MYFGFVAVEENYTRSYQNRGKSPKIQLFGGQTMGLAFRTVVHLILPQFFLTGEGSKTTIQIDGLCLSSSALFNTFMFFYNLKWDKAVSDLETYANCSEEGSIHSIIQITSYSYLGLKINRCTKFWQKFYFNYEDAVQIMHCPYSWVLLTKLSIKHKFIDSTHKFKQLF